MLTATMSPSSAAPRRLCSLRRLLPPTAGTGRPQVTNPPRRSLSYSSSSSPSDEERRRRLLSGNGGTVEGVWLFHRHGDRTPSRPLVADRRVEDESCFWRTRIPYPDRSVYEALSRRYPPEVHASNGPAFLDAGREPYGFLTYRGMDQMRTAGRRCARRYAQHGHQAALRDGRTVLNGDGGTDAADAAAVSEDLLRHWDVRACSTNYLRTVKSAQCFLDGLVGGGGGRTEEDSDGRYWDGLVRDVLRDGEPPDGGGGIGAVGGGGPSVSVSVRDRSNDALNAFDRDPDLMRDLVADVVSSPSFLSHDATRAPLAARLANVLPGLARRGGKSTFPSPSGINWIHAADHFVCRSAHAVPYARYSNAEDEGTAEAAESYLRAASHLTLAHLAWRFRRWYSSPPLLAAVAAPPLREIERQMRDALELDAGDRRPLSIYSCHDVTILGLLYGVGAAFLSEEEGSGGDGGNGGGWRNFWPPYASTLIFELVRVEDGHRRGDPDDTHAVRILLNGKPVRVLSGGRRRDDDAKNGGGGGGDGDRPLRHADFAKIIDDLEANGGWGEGGRLEDAGPEGAEKERDMSGWTG